MSDTILIGGIEVQPDHQHPFRVVDEECAMVRACGPSEVPVDRREEFVVSIYPGSTGRCSHCKRILGLKVSAQLLDVGPLVGAVEEIR